MHAEPERSDKPASSISSISSVVRQLAIPQGFTLTTAGTLALLIQMHPRPGSIATFLFIVGATVGFCSIVQTSGVQRETAPIKPATGAQLFNVTPLVVVPIAILAVSWIPSPHIAFTVAGLLTTWIYVLAMAFLLRYFADPE